MEGCGALYTHNLRPAVTYFHIMLLQTAVKYSDLAKKNLVRQQCNAKTILVYIRLDGHRTLRSHESAASV